MTVLEKDKLNPGLSSVSFCYKFNDDWHGKERWKRKIQKFEYLKKEKSFFSKMKNIFHNFAFFIVFECFLEVPSFYMCSDFPYFTITYKFTSSGYIYSRLLIFSVTTGAEIQSPPGRQKALIIPICCACLIINTYADFKAVYKFVLISCYVIWVISKNQDVAKLNINWFCG